MRRFRLAVLCFTLTILQLSVSAAQSKPAPDAPIPAQIMVAKRVFIANGGSDQLTEDDPIFTGGPDRAYNQFYAGIKNWGRFNLVGSPSDADLLLEIRQEVSNRFARGQSRQFRYAAISPGDTRPENERSAVGLSYPFQVWCGAGEQRPKFRSASESAGNGAARAGNPGRSVLKS